MMAHTSDDKPLIVQGDLTVLVAVDSPAYGEARDRLVRFAELVKSPEHIHTYRVTPLSIWNACAAGCTSDWIVQSLEALARYPLPPHVARQVRDLASRYGRLKLSHGADSLVLWAQDAALAEEVSWNEIVRPLLGARLSAVEIAVPPAFRGQLKQALIRIGWPAEDLAGYCEGEGLSIQLRASTQSGRSFALRGYQLEAAAAFHASGSARGGSGVIVLPCGAGKTIVGLAAMAQTRSSTLILTPSITAVRQWIAEILDKTGLQEDQVGEYTGALKQVRPVTATTYQVLTHRPSKNGQFPHMEIFNQRNWGLIIYDEVHLLPAPVFQATADLQARRRLGLTATLVREDGREDDVFALIGPKKADVPWKELESQGWIATAICTEVRLPLPEAMRMDSRQARQRGHFAICTGWTTLELTEVQIESCWENMLKAFIWQRLLPLGGAAIGRPQTPGSSCALALTGAGRYLLGLCEDFDYGRPATAALVVQPNFDVVFLSPDAVLEATCSRFAERLAGGQHVGTLFRITRSSITAAAAVGLALDHVLATLTHASTKPLPANVEHEVRGWFAGFRSLRVRPATLIECPDAQTAARVVACAGADAARISDLILEFRGTGGKTALIKALRAQGLFVK